MNEVQMALSGVAAVTGALGVLWATLASKIAKTEAACEEDRKALRALLQSVLSRVNQLDRRKDDNPPSAY